MEKEFMTDDGRTALTNLCNLATKMKDTDISYLMGYMQRASEENLKEMANDSTANTGKSN